MSISITYKAKYEVCPRCQGAGTITDPSIDGKGISPDEFFEDPDFAEAYFSGAYDITCSECDGDRVVLVTAENLTNEDQDYENSSQN